MGPIGIALMALLALPVALRAQGPSPVPGGRVRTGTLSFDGHATAGDFVGTTSSVSGELRGAPALAGVRGWVGALVRTLKTGNNRRDRDLNKSMESGKYPTMRFELRGVRAAPGAGAGGPVRAELLGALTLHGVTRTVRLPALIDFRGGIARLRSDFGLNLKDYRIGGLSKMLGMLKMHERIEVHVDLSFALIGTR